MLSLSQLSKLQSKLLQKIKSLETEDEFEKYRVKIFGRKGRLANLTQKIKILPPQQRPIVGRAINKLQNLLNLAFEEKRQELGIKEKEEIGFDPTLPAEKPPQGHLHLVTYAIREIESILKEIGFVRQRYLEIETDFYAFESLNMPPGHPARDEWETFFIEDKFKRRRKDSNLILTPHTSSAQVREMEKGVLPIRMMNISKCYRRQIDINHTPMFHQFEGLMVDKGVNFGHLKWTLNYFVERFFGKKRKIRIRPFHFQFTEPSFEIDISCVLCKGRGCRYCKAGWSELGGAGMVHPQVLKAGKIDPQKYSGFAFGWGVERVYMMREGLSIPDLRMLYENDLRFLQQF